MRQARASWIRLSIAALILLVGGFIAHVTIFPHKTDQTPVPSPQRFATDSKLEKAKENKAGIPDPAVQGASPPPLLEGKDRATLRLVPGGQVTLPENLRIQAGKMVQVNSFYLDETHVTNHQYVGFLNRVLAKLIVDKGVVRSGNEIWLFLGEVTEGYEPIVFQDNAFEIKNPSHASCPVLRVTGYGAAAYARFYGRRLPTEAEWLHAVQVGVSAEGKSPEKISEPVTETHVPVIHSQMHAQPREACLRKQPTPVLLFKPDALGIRGLNGEVAEWGLRTLGSVSNEKTEEPEYLVLGGHWSDATERDTHPLVVPRHPWEAFEGVGFRCALNTKGQGKE